MSFFLDSEVYANICQAAGLHVCIYAYAVGGQKIMRQWVFKITLLMCAILHVDVDVCMHGVAIVVYACVCMYAFLLLHICVC